ncbi:hypothetical protein IC006_0573 [Sulfuracidifex tepidarius]|uniref:Uncharacterized protein n=1 Tax=Sulfuracidifex tepidarius TaxID=1294262 RepID=A0A510DT02_9CREN|nr:hypothetical protein IC006_0573 [Sulfuracidifex tepidarius]
MNEVAFAVSGQLLGVQVTELEVLPSTLYYVRRLGVRRKEARPRCPSSNSDRVVRDCPSRGRVEYKYKVCGRIFYGNASHRTSSEQRERVLREYLDRRA